MSIARVVVVARVGVRVRRVKAKARSSAIAIIDLDVRGQLAQTIQRSTFSRRDRAVISARQAGHCVIRAMLGALARSEAGQRPVGETDSEVPPGSAPVLGLPY